MSSATYSARTYPPLPTSNTAFVSIDALASALRKLGITNVSASKLLDTVKEEAQSTWASNRSDRSEERRNALLQLAVRPDENQPGTIPPYKSVVTQRRVTSSTHSTKSQERRQRLRDIAKSSFPGGQFPEPYSSFWLQEFRGNTYRHLPFILSNIVISPLEVRSNLITEQNLENVWCLWDTGAHISQVLSSQVDPRITREQTNGQVHMAVKFPGLDFTFECILALRETMPNNSTFIIFGQHTFLNRIQYSIQPCSINPLLRVVSPSAFGQLTIHSYSDPLNDDVIAVDPVFL